MCENYNCQFRELLEKMLKIKEFSATEKKTQNEIFNNCKNPEMTAKKCMFADTICCAKYPDCETVKSQRAMTKIGLMRENLLSSALSACTDGVNIGDKRIGGTGKCLDQLDDFISLVNKNI